MNIFGVGTVFKRSRMHFFCVTSYHNTFVYIGVQADFDDAVHVRQIGIELRNPDTISYHVVDFLTIGDKTIFWCKNTTICWTSENEMEIWIYFRTICILTSRTNLFQQQYCVIAIII